MPSRASFDGQTLAVSLSMIQDQWQMDHIDDFIDFDSRSNSARRSSTAPSAAGTCNAAEGKCIEKHFESLPPKKLEQPISSQATR